MGGGYKNTNMKLLSIVIPTRGREYYCIEAIKDILSYKRDDFELVICDNSDTDQIDEYLQANPDERVVYQHIRGRINSVINMDTAMRMATGEYVCMIGDDDTILPTIFDAVLLAKNNDYNIVSPRDVVVYFWPKALKEEGILSWALRVNEGGATEMDSESQLKAFVKNGCLTYSDVLPRIYHGIVKRNILEKILNETGHIIGGLSPDIYLSISTTCNSKKFTVIKFPITIAGACPRSTTSESNTGGHRGRIEDAPHLFNRGPYVWDERIPRIYTVQTIWAETAMKAFEEMGRTELIKQINQGYLYAEMIRKNRTMIKDLIPAIKYARPISGNVLNMLNFSRYFLLKPIQRLGRGEIKSRSIEDVKSISIASKMYMEIINEHV